MIVLEEITMKFGSQPVLDGISMAVASSEILVLLGPSGCGKTTLLRIIAGLDRPDDGRLFIDDVQVSNHSRGVPPHKRKIALIFQDLALWPHMTAREHLEFVLQREKPTKDILESKTEQILNSVNLGRHGDRYPHKLSGGEQQRLAIARGIASRPRYLLMDEPFSNLDSILKSELEPVILDLKKRLHMGIIYVTHHIEEALALADRIAIMNEGKLIETGTPKEVMYNSKNEFVRRLLKI